MGLLDDAIREHLELKRKHGANPDDVARQEQEALGPGQRNEFAQPEGAAQAPPSPSRRAASRAPDAGPPAEEPPPVRAGPRAAVDELPEGEPGIPERAAELRAAAPGYDEDPWLDDEPDEVPADEALQHAPRREPAATGREEEDVLEETPDFLQETPEHDRLWFEQKPPRDFDWDPEERRTDVRPAASRRCQVPHPRGRHWL